MTATTPAADFALEPSDGNIPERVIVELREAYSVAHDYAQSYSDAITAQADKYKLKPSALKKVISALEKDTVEKLNEEMTDIDRLLGHA